MNRNQNVPCLGIYTHFSTLNRKEILTHAPKWIQIDYEKSKNPITKRQQLWETSKAARLIRTDNIIQVKVDRREKGAQRDRDKK